MMTSELAWNQVWNLSKQEGAYSYVPSRWTRADDKVGYWIQSGIPFRPGEKVLEAGCGDAAVLIRLMKLFKVEGCGVDFSDSALIQARSLAQKERCDARFYRADVCQMPFESGSFDKVISLGVVEHMPDISPSIQEMARVLRPHGLMILMTPNRKSFGRVQRRLASWAGRWPYGYQDEYTPEELARELERNGLKVIKSEAVHRRRMPHEPTALKWIRRLDAGFGAISSSWGFYSYVFATKEVSA